MQRLMRGLGQFALILGALVMTAPFVLMALTSLMTYAQTMAYPPEWLPHPVTTGNYIKALTETPLWRDALNSLIVALAVVVGQVVTGSMAGFAFARLRFPGRQALFFTVLATMMVPVYVVLVPLFALMALVGWIDTYQALILPGMTGAFSIFLFRQWFLKLPPELEDAARIDGCTPWDLYWRIALPTALPAIGTLAIFEFLASWNTFLWPLIVTNSESMRTLPVALAAFKGSMKEVTDWGLLMAAMTVAVAPPIAVFLLGQKFFLKGLMDGSVKS
ncbi:MAG: carbohydrate ABC transporter permease [Candidatus Sericytochromatia bacterium]|nr:carbohydrate ABC transporter permease [Candidatus Sericytochromatia bacterium]